MSEPTQPRTVEEYKAALQAEWGKYVATETIFVDGVRAVNEGDPVPASLVDQDNPVVDKSKVRDVAKEAAKAARAADSGKQG